MKILVVLLGLISVYAVAPAQEAAKLSRDVTVFGAVRNPGIVTLRKEDWGLVEAITKMGGLTQEADIRHVIVRFKAGGEKVYNLEAIYRKTEKNPQLSDGDVVVVRKLNGEEPIQPLQPTVRPSSISGRQRMSPTNSFRFEALQQTARSAVNDLKPQPNDPHRMRPGIL